MWSYFKHKTQTQLIFHFSLSLKRPKYSHSYWHSNIQTSNPHSTGDKHISSATGASHQRQKTHLRQKTLVSSHRRPLTQNLTQLSHYLTLRSVVKHRPSPSIFTHKHLAILLSFITTLICSLSNHINPLGILFFPHFHITPNQIHKTLRFYSDRNQVLQTRDQWHFSKKIES